MSSRRRQATERIVKGVCLVTAFALVGILFLIISLIFINGLPSLSWYFITTPENAAKGLGEGIANAIVGTILISLSATILAAPFGFGTAVYMKRYAADNGITRAFRFLLEVLSGTPSIVIGIFAFLVFVIYLKKITGGFSLIAGSLALAILIMPVIERAIEDAIDRVPAELEEGSYALGATKWQTIHGITIPAAFSAILTGFTLGFGRAAEESAVVILSAGYTQYLPEFAIRSGSDAVGTIKLYPLQDQVATLPYTVYHSFQNQVLVRPSAGFAAAFVLVVVVFTINITAKALLRSTVSTGKTGDSFFGKLLKGRRAPAIPLPSSPSTGAGNAHESPEEDDWAIPAAVFARPGEPAEDSSSRQKKGSSSRVRNLTASLPFLKKKEKSPAPDSGDSSSSLEGQKKPAAKIPREKAMIFVRAFIPFAIPAAILLLISFLASVPPLHDALGPVSASLAGIFATGLSLIITVAGLVFAFIMARKGGAFRVRNLRAGAAGVAAGFCILCIAGIVASSAAAGLFSTGENTTSAGTDRTAQLAAMLASGQLGDSSAPAETPAAVPTAASTPAPQGENPSSLVPDKDALSLHEYYTYGSGPRTVRATVYDTKILPYYFWWYIDYNRFVQSSPAPGDSYLVVYIRAEDTGSKSAMIPSANQYNLTYHGTSYPHLPYLNTSVFSDYQLDYYSNHYDKLPYQWIREIGQDRRDYAFQTQYIAFNWNSTTSLPNGATIPNTENGTKPSGTSLDTKYSGFFIKPGSSNAIDGYLIYEVPEAVTTDLSNAYMTVSFNQLSITRWKLG